MNTGKVDVLLGLQWGDEGKGKAWNEFDKRLDGEKYECLIPKEIEPHVIE